MDKTYKFLVSATVVFIVALFIYIGIQHRRINRLSNDNQLQSVELSTLKDSVSIFKDKNGELTYKLSVVEISNKNTKESLETMGFDLKKLKQKDIELNKVTTALRLQLAATGKGETTLIDTVEIFNTDTILSTKFAWSNNFLSLNGNIRVDRMKFDYKYKTGIDFITEDKRRGTVVSVMLSDPNAAIISGNSITVAHKKRFWEKPWLWGLAGLTTGILISK